jgi:hypothetical protein
MDNGLNYRSFILIHSNKKDTLEIPIRNSLNNDRFDIKILKLIKQNEVDFIIENPTEDNILYLVRKINHLQDCMIKDFGRI